MALDAKYLVTLSLNELFRDKDTGNPLSNGYILFKRDIARTEDKTVYTLEGSPPNYTYRSLGARIDLNGDGTPGYLNNNIPIYYYPRDEDGNPDLYYVEVYNEDDVLQFPRQAWPNYIPESAVQQQSEFINFIPNGQFKNHINVPGTTATPGLITQAETIIAYGGWRFVRPPGSTAVDVVTFERFSSFTTSPEDSPRYAFRVRNELPGSGDTFKDLRIRFNDVNKFQSPLGQTWSLGIEGKSNTGASIIVQAVLIKNYGTGGDTPTETPLGNLTLPTGYGIASLLVNFGDNTGKIIGPNDDDYLEIAFRYPLNTGFDAAISNAGLLQGTVQPYVFPPQTDEQNNYRSIVPAQPAYDGSDLYLNTVLTKNGLEYDEDGIADITASLKSSKRGYLLCDGSQYETAGTSAEGIPYSRLQAALFDHTVGVPITGTGKNYSTSFSVGTGQFLIFNNSLGSVTAIADGSVATGFTFQTVYTGGDRFCDAYVRGATFYLRNKNPGAIDTIPSENGFNIAPAIDITYEADSTGIAQSTGIRRSAYYYTCPAAAGLAGKWVRFRPVSNSIVAQLYYLWFTVDGAGTDPAIAGYTGFQVNLKSTYTATQVAAICAAAMTGVQISFVQTVAASAIPIGAFFTFNSTTTGFYPWFKKDGAGTDPAPSGRIGILTNIVAADTADQVKSKIIAAINSKYFAVPDFRGQVLKGLNPANLSTRFNTNWLGSATGIGTMEPDGVAAHHHGVPAYTSSVIGPADKHYIGHNLSSTALNDRLDFATTFTGDPETRVFNMAVNYFIKY